MAGEKYVPSEESRAELIVLNSRFIASAAPTSTVGAAKGYIQKIRSEFPNANHHVNAFIIGHGNNTVTHSSDDGEPSGTAGRPVLSVLTGSGFGDVCLVVTRFFGGTKLGTGGLVRAYTDSSKSVLANLGKSVKILTSTFQVQLHYNLVDRFKLIVNQYQGKIVSTDYMTEVNFTIQLPVDKINLFVHAVYEISSGKSIINVLTENDESVIPL